MVRKLISNLGIRSIKVLGWKITLSAWVGFFINLPRIWRTRNLFPLDKHMSHLGEIKVNGRLGYFNINPNRIDQLIDEDSSAFSMIREIYVKDCYLRFHNMNKEEIHTVVDLGGNRGMVSAMFTPVAHQIIVIEAQEKYNNAINEILSRQNNFSNYKIGNYFVGTNEYVLKNEHKVSFTFLCEFYQLDSIDFLKMDIEGSEFDILDELPFSRIKYISMEVHRDHGNPGVILDKLDKSNFAYILSDSNFQQTTDSNKVDYIYAWNKVSTKG